MEVAAVERHATQFDRDLASRPAGSQQEFAAASYLTAHFQKAGYLVELDAVPVEDLVRSSNVVALPPSREEPAIVVAAGYDTTPGSRPAGATLGTLLEVARALRVAVPEHSVQFVALGAEHTGLGGGRLGSRRLARVLQDAELDPEIVQLVAIADGEKDAFDGPAEDDFCRLALEARPEPRGGGAVACSSVGLGIDPDPFEGAGFERTLVDAGSGFGAVLLDYLIERSQ